MNCLGKREVKVRSNEQRRVDGKGRLDGYLQTENMEEKPRVLAS